MTLARQSRTIVSLLPCALFSLALAIATTLPATAQREVEFPGAGGYPLRGSLWSGEAGAPGVVLLHQCDGDQSMYRDLGSRLAERGLHALSFDLRGIGASAGEALDRDGGPERDFWPRVEGDFPEDLRAATAWLRRSPGVAGGRVGVVGASCGGSLAVDLALEPAGSAVRALVFLSSRQSPEQVARLAPLDATVPTFWIAAEGDRRAAEAARLGFQRSRHERSRVLIFPGQEHGAPLFERQPELIGEIAAWLEANLR